MPHFWENRVSRRKRLPCTSQLRQFSSANFNWFSIIFVCSIGRCDENLIKLMHLDAVEILNCLVFAIVNIFPLNSHQTHAEEIKW